MSYILDALRRADAERERGRVPDLHARPLSSAATQDEPVHAMPWRWIGIAGVALLVVVLGWRWAGSEAPPALTEAPPSAPVPSTSPAVRHPPAPPALHDAPAPTVSVVAAAPPRPSVAVAKSATPAPAASSAAATAPASAPAAAAAGRIVTLAELPPELRRTLPPLAIGGSMYSENPANRMLIVNGQLFHENDKPAADVTLEQIRLKSAVLRYKGYRFELSY